MVILKKQRDFQFAKAQREQRKRDRREKKRVKRLCPMFSHLEREFDNVTASEVAQLLLNEFNMDKAVIEFSSGRKLTLIEILDTVNDNNIDARSVSPIKFWGGPPNGEAKQFTGSLLTMLFDQILYNHALDGSYAELVGKPR